MSDLKLFKLNRPGVVEIHGAGEALEKNLQALFEGNLQALIGVKFLATEHSTGRLHGGRIDTLGIDENGCPVIIEYKRSVGREVVNQGLFYLDWLMDHRADFELLVRDSEGVEAGASIDWNAPRLICVATDFNKYDIHAVRQINRNIDLLRYRKFGEDLLAIDLVASVSADSRAHSVSSANESRGPARSDAEELASRLTGQVADIFCELREEVAEFGDDVSERWLKQYLAFKRIRNFATLVPQKSKLVLYLHIDPSTVDLKDERCRDVSKQSHWGTGNLEFNLKDAADLRDALPLIRRAYDEG